jgi:hypothetical protein
MHIVPAKPAEFGDTANGRDATLHGKTEMVSRG